MRCVTTVKDYSFIRRVVQICFHSAIRIHLADFDLNYSNVGVRDATTSSVFKIYPRADRSASERFVIAAKCSTLRLSRRAYLPSRTRTRVPMGRRK